jgi:hypothetical protein
LIAAIVSMPRNDRSFPTNQQLSLFLYSQKSGKLFQPLNMEDSNPRFGNGKEGVNDNLNGTDDDDDDTEMRQTKL